MAHAGHGAVVTFIGRARDRADDDRVVVELEYEVYPEMAESVLAEVADEAEAALGRGRRGRPPPRGGPDRRGGRRDRHGGEASRRGVRGESIRHRGDQGPSADLEARAICRWKRVEASRRLIRLRRTGGRLNTAQPCFGRGRRAKPNVRQLRTRRQLGRHGGAPASMRGQDPDEEARRARRRGEATLDCRCPARTPRRLRMRDTVRRAHRPSTVGIG